MDAVTVAFDDVDYTSAQTLLELADHLKERGIVFAVAKATDDVRAAFHNPSR